MLTRALTHNIKRIHSIILQRERSPKMQKEYNLGEIVYCPRSRRYYIVLAIDSDGLPISAEIRPPFSEKKIKRVVDKGIDLQKEKNN